MVLVAENTGLSSNLKCEVIRSNQTILCSLLVDNPDLVVNPESLTLLDLPVDWVVGIDSILGKKID